VSVTIRKYDIVGLFSEGNASIIFYVLHHDFRKQAGMCNI
jgi:hypothetical protein